MLYFPLFERRHGGCRGLWFRGSLRRNIISQPAINFVWAGQAILILSPRDIQPRTVLCLAWMHLYSNPPVVSSFSLIRQWHLRITLALRMLGNKTMLESIGYFKERFQLAESELIIHCRSFHRSRNSLVCRFSPQNSRRPVSRKVS